MAFWNRGYWRRGNDERRDRDIGGDWRERQQYEDISGRGREHGWSYGPRYIGDDSVHYHVDRDEGYPRGYEGRDRDMAGERLSGERMGNDRFRERENQAGRWGGGSYYGDADYGIGLGGWREQGRAMMDDRRYRSDQPGMSARGNYGMDDYRGRDWSRERDWDAGRDWGQQLGGRVAADRTWTEGSGMGYRAPDADFRYGGAGSSGVRPDMAQDDRYAQSSYSGMGGMHYGTGGSQLGDIGRGWSTDFARRDDRRLGRGPRSYSRSDERIREDVCDRLMQSWMNAEDVDVKVDNGEVTLEGFVDNRHEKRAIEDLTDSILGVKEVHNHLRVRGGLRSQLGLDASKRAAPHVSATIVSDGSSQEASTRTGATTTATAPQNGTQTARGTTAGTDRTSTNNPPVRS